MARRALCTTTNDAYHRLANLTLESVQEVYEDEGDDSPELALEVEYAVRTQQSNFQAYAHHVHKLSCPSLHARARYRMAFLTSLLALKARLC